MSTNFGVCVYFDFDVEFPEPTNADGRMNLDVQCPELMRLINAGIFMLKDRT